MTDVPRSRVPFDVDQLVRRSTSGLCFVCEFLRGNPAYEHVLIAETPTAVVFLNKYPTLFGNVIVAPKEHREQATGEFRENEYLELQRLIYQVAEAMRRVLSPERIYILSIGSQAASSHVHWHIAALPPGVPLEQQQYHAMMHERGVVQVGDTELREYAEALRNELRAED